MAKESRVVQLQMDLAEMGYKDSLKALNWMISVMNAENGYKRHDGRHYYYHLVDTTQDLINHGVTDEATLTACILHDAIEDVPDINYEGVKSLFGNAVADLVLRVTKDPDIDYKKDKEALALYLEIILQDWRTAVIKTVDRKHNMSTLKDASPDKELRQALETEKYFIPFFKEARKLHPNYSRFFHSAKTTLMPHIIKIKQYHALLTEHERQVKEIKAYLHSLRTAQDAIGIFDYQIDMYDVIDNVKTITKGGTLK